MNGAGEKVCVVTLGCARNVVDSEKALGDLLRAGARRQPLARASTVVLNTCGFTEEAKRESLEAIEDLVRRKRSGKIRALYVSGCLVERYRRQLSADFPDVDGWQGVAAFPSKGITPAAARLTGASSAFLKIAEGCANLCTYCAIPMIKGALRSRPQADILREARALDRQGVKEINIIGQDITLYGLTRPGRPDALPLVRLLRRMLAQTRFPWIRLLYLHPARVSDDLIDLIAGEPRLCSYADIPFQHVHPRILRAMGRRTRGQEIPALVEKLRRRIPGVALRTSFIVGFPGETKREFGALCNAVTALRFDRMGVFAYSREEGTAAYRLPGQRSRRVKEERRDHLMRLQEGISAENLRRDVGRSLEVLIEAPGRGKSAFLGRSYKDAPEVDGVVHVRSRRRLAVGSLVRCRVTSSSAHDLYAEPLE
ncbi:MAG: MiaB/RimO family radical SAM methylthiotransferase [Deltaproteobacteria bacterium]